MEKSNFADEFTGKHVMSIWWALLWRGVVYGIPIGFILGAIVGVVVAALGRPDLVDFVGAMLGTIIYVPVSFLITMIVLKKRYGSFSIRLMSHDSAAA
jgi:uncharacterized membrane protein YjjP (DUF1212 family)